MEKAERNARPQDVSRKKVHRCFASFSPDDAEIVLTDGGTVHHLATVLRLQVGEPLMVVHNGYEAMTTVQTLQKRTILVRVDSVSTVAAEPKRELSAYVAMFKKEPFEWMLEKLTEVGVRRIIPVMSERTVRFPWKPDRYQAILLAAAQQSGRGVIPVFMEPMSLDKALKDAEACALRVMFELDSPPLQPEKMGKRDSSGRIAMFIGPEGGWTDAEILAAKKAGIVPAGLGGLTLRAETAAIVGAHRLLWTE